MFSLLGAQTEKINTRNRLQRVFPPSSEVDAYTTGCLKHRAGQFRHRPADRTALDHLEAGRGDGSGAKAFTWFGVWVWGSCGPGGGEWTTGSNVNMIQPLDKGCYRGTSLLVFCRGALGLQPADQVSEFFLRNVKTKAAPSH